MLKAFILGDKQLGNLFRTRKEKAHYNLGTAIIVSRYFSGLNKIVLIIIT